MATAGAISSIPTHKRKVLLKVLVIGDSGVGKTSLLQRYVTGKFDRGYRATIGADFLPKELVIDDKLVTLQIWDTAGQERFQSLGQTFYRGAQACIVVYDVTDRKTLENADGWIDDFLVHAGVPNPDAFPVGLFGNKVDLGESRRAVSSADAAAWVASHGSGVVTACETSAKDDTNVAAAFQQIAERALLAEAQNKPVLPPIGTRVRLEDTPAVEPSKPCCG